MSSGQLQEVKSKDCNAVTLNSGRGRLREVPAIEL